VVRDRHRRVGTPETDISGGSAERSVKPAASGIGLGYLLQLPVGGCWVRRSVRRSRGPGPVVGKVVLRSGMVGSKLLTLMRARTGTGHGPQHVAINTDGVHAPHIPGRASAVDQSRRPGASVPACTFSLTPTLYRFSRTDPKAGSRFVQRSVEPQIVPILSYLSTDSLTPAPDGTVSLSPGADGVPFFSHPRPVSLVSRGDSPVLALRNQSVPILSHLRARRTVSLAPGYPFPHTWVPFLSHPVPFLSQLRTVSLTPRTA